MTTKNNIDEIHQLIINSDNPHKTFIDNLELWKEFYEDRNTIFRNNITDEKLFVIIKFLLEQEKGEIFDYFHSNIIGLLKQEQKNIPFALRDNSSKTEEDINKLFNNLKNHDDLCGFLETLQIEDVFGDIKQYSNKELELYTIPTLTLIIYNNFFNLDPDLVKKTIDFISKKSISIQKNEINRNMMNLELIYQYQEKLLPIKSFIGANIKDDELINQIKTHQIKDKKLLLKMFKELSVDNILEIFDDKLENLLSFLTEVDYLDEVDKQTIINTLFDKIIKKDGYSIYLLELIIKNNQNQLWNRYLTSQKYNEIIMNCLNATIVYLDSDMIKFLLNDNLKNTSTNIEKAQEKFIMQCQYFIRQEEYLSKKENFDIEGIKKILTEKSLTYDNEEYTNELTINENDSITVKAEKASKLFKKGLDIEFKTAIELLTSYFANEINLNEISMQAIIRSIATEMLKQLNIENNGVYYFKNDSTNGFFSPQSKTININYNLISKFLNKNLPLYNRLKVLETTPHEIKHALIYENKKRNIWDKNSYEMEKENVLRKYDSAFYDENYHVVKEEIDARINGADRLLKFIETYLPQYLNIIQDEIIRNLNSEKRLMDKQDSERKMLFLGKLTTKFHLGFDTLIRYNPDILIEHLIFNIEYTSKGIPKTYDELLATRTEENKEIVDDIIKRRYPEMMTQELKQKYM